MALTWVLWAPHPAPCPFVVWQEGLLPDKLGGMKGVCRAWLVSAEKYTTVVHAPFSIAVERACFVSTPCSRVCIKSSFVPWLVWAITVGMHCMHPHPWCGASACDQLV